MTIDEIDIQKSEASKLATGKLSRKRKRRWLRRVHVRAARIKRQLQIENSFHKAMCEMTTTTDIYRQSYLHWILNNMFSLFSYETGLQAITDKAAYEKWLSANGR
jgi:hypothetical protein